MATPITTSGSDGAPFVDEREAIALLLTVAAYPTGDWQCVAAAHAHVAASSRQDGYSPARLRTHYHRLLAHYRGVIQSNGGEGAFPGSAELRGLLARALQTEDARARQLHHGHNTAQRRAYERQRCAAPARSEQAPTRPEFTELRAKDLLEPSFASAPMILASCNPVTRKRQWHAEVSPARRVVQRVHVISPASVGAAPTSPDSLTQRSTNEGNDDDQNSDVALAQGEASPSPHVGLENARAPDKAGAAHVQHQPNNKTNVDALRRQLAEVMVSVHHMRADLTKQVADLSRAVTAETRERMLVEKELYELRVDHGKLKQENIEQRIAINRLQADLQPRIQRNRRQQEDGAALLVSTPEATFVALARHVDRTAVDNSRLKQEVLTLSYRTKMLECTVEACETLLREHDKKLEASDRKFATLGRSLGEMHARMTHTEENVTDEVSKRVVLQDTVTADRENFKQTMDNHRRAGEQLVETIRSECDRVVSQTSEVMTRQQSSECAVDTVQRDMLALVDRMKKLERGEVACSHSTSFAMISTTFEHVEAKLVAGVQEREALREALNAQQARFDEQQRCKCVDVAADMRLEWGPMIDRVKALEASERQLHGEIASCRAELERHQVRHQEQDQIAKKLEGSVGDERRRCMGQHVNVLTTLKAMLETDLIEP